MTADPGLSTQHSALSTSDLAAESVVVKIRWFGLVVGYAYANLSPHPAHPELLNAILGLGLLFTTADTLWSVRGRILFGRWPLVVSAMEALFIGLLCQFDRGPDSPFRFYYLLSLICCAVRYSARVAYATFALDGASMAVLWAAQPVADRSGLGLALTLVVMGWATWASAALTGLLRAATADLQRLNVALEDRIAERTRALQEAQGHVIHQEKMAAFGLLAAGIAHEVGNPLTSVSAIVQLLQRRDPDEYTRDRLALVSGQLDRIRGTLRELTNYGRPHRREKTRVSPAEIVAEAVGIAKYAKGVKSRALTADVPPGLPPWHGSHDQLVQVFLNLILNAIDATGKGGRVAVAARLDGGRVEVSVTDDGVGMTAEQAAKVFQPYFTTKPHGTGLGLFVTRQIVDDHGGRVEFESAPGRTVFRVSLPVWQPAGARLQDSNMPPGGGHVESWSVGVLPPQSG